MTQNPSLSPLHAKKLASQGWTNPSVQAFMGTQDPVLAIERRARQVVFEALDKGWSGPPFDPIKLAEILKIDVRPQIDILDARTISAGVGKFAIEFNPRQPRERVRFSIAHEIAHTLFPDCDRAVRNRGGRDHSRPDDWQLEMLCNIAAAEILMPLGGLSRIAEAVPTIENLMTLRQEFEVSAEALLIRVAKVTATPLFAFCASRPNDDDSGDFRIDYTIPSRSWDHKSIPPRQLKGNTVLRECTAIGYTAHRLERWPSTAGDLEVQCVGLAPYPGKRFPRVAGIARPARGHRAVAPRIEYLIGDALEPRGSGARFVCHIVNDGASLWGGGGFAAAVRRRYPTVQEDFKVWSHEPDRPLKLGNVRYASISENIVLASMVAQRGYGPSTSPRIRYAALERCLELVATEASQSSASVHMPRIGTGAAGGSWPIIEEIVTQRLLAKGIAVSIYDLPRKNAPHSQSDFLAELR